jgi:tetratricopeptide (TPR) repeat protein
VPLIGLFVIVAWASAELASGGKNFTVAVAGTAAGLLIACALVTRVQLAYWHDSVALWQHTVLVTGPNALAHYSLAVAYRDLGRLDDAVEEFRTTLRIEPNDDRCRRQLCLVLSKEGKSDEALTYFRGMLGIPADEAAARLQFAAFLINQHFLEQARIQLAEAARLQPRLRDSPNFQAAERAAGVQMLP